MATEDLSLMHTLPNMAVVQPADTVETRGVVEYISRHEGPVFLSVQDFAESGIRKGSTGSTDCQPNTLALRPWNCSFRCRVAFLTSGAGKDDKPSTRLH